jgi:hypothetical protein
LRYRLDLLATPDGGLGNEAMQQLERIEIETAELKLDRAQAAEGTVMRQALIATISAAFDQEEMAAHIGDLDVAGKIDQATAVSAQARELVDYFRRRKRLAKLVTVLKSERPGLDWPDIG